MDVLSNIWTYLMEQDFAHRFVTVIIVILFFSSIVLLLGILVSRTIKNKKERESDLWHEKFQALLVNILFDAKYEPGTDDYKRLIKKYHADKLNAVQQKALIGEMDVLHKNVAGETSEKLEAFYHDVGLIPYAVERVKDGKWWEKAGAFRELSEFKAVSQYDLILKYVDHDNKTLRAEAQYAAVSLKGVNALHFVESLKYPMSEWQQLVMLEKLARYLPEEIPDVRHWLSSDNDSVVIFGLKVIAQFQQFNAEKQVIELLVHKNPRVVKQDIQSLVRLQFKSACPFLRRIYSDSPKSIKLQIIDALSELGDSGDRSFFRELVEDQDDFEIGLRAGMALRNLGGRSILQQLDRKELTEQRRKIVTHALDERI
ncbi:HEAT repeat domain-containing protein [bacterium SCSIO 12741]|nr:HEAT repeat domain-containing protein [bacterium SCSIO 12741]